MKNVSLLATSHDQPAKVVLEGLRGDGSASPSGKAITVALAGQPNVGKSTVFNVLTGLNQHVGNWPGKTIEQKVGTYRYNGTIITIVDLPGTYSLSANSPEELIAREYIIRERPDVVVVIINAAALERNLYLLAELLALPSPVVVGLNMVDVADHEGIKIEPEVLEAALGVPVVPMVATKNRGIDDLVAAIARLATGDLPYEPKVPEIRPDHKDVLAELCGLCAGQVPAPYPPEWVALKLLEGDAKVTRMMEVHLPDDVWQKVYAILHAHEDAVIDVAGGRYEWIGRMTRAALVRPRLGQVTFTDRLDRVATHPFWGLLLLAGMLGLVFGLTYTIGAPLQDWLNSYVIGGLAGLAGQLLANAPAWLRGLVIDGVLGGAGMVVTFVPSKLKPARPVGRGNCPAAYGSSASSTKRFLSTYPTRANSPRAMGSIARPSSSCGVPEARLSYSNTWTHPAAVTRITLQNRAMGTQVSTMIIRCHKGRSPR